jgi:hypothetical protein
LAENREPSIIQDYSFGETGQLQVAELFPVIDVPFNAFSLLFHHDDDWFPNFFQDSLTKSSVMRVNEGKFLQSVSILGIVVIVFIMVSQMVRKSAKYKTMCGGSTRTIGPEGTGNLLKYDN